MQSVSEAQVHLNALYKDSYGIHDLSNRFKHQSRNLREISINAAIAAGHAGNHIKTFTEIANQIGIISSAMSESIHQIQTETAQIINRMLECLLKSEQREMFRQARNEVAKPELRTMLQNISISLADEIAELLEHTYDNLGHLKSERLNLRQINNRIWSLVTNLRTSAGLMDSEEELFYLSIAESLEQMNQETSLALTEFFQILKVLDCRLLTSCEWLGRCPNAA